MRIVGWKKKTLMCRKGREVAGVTKGEINEMKIANRKELFIF